MTPRMKPRAAAATHGKDGYDKFESIAKGLAALLIPVVLAYGSQLVQKQISDESVKKDYVALAVSILKDVPKENDQRSDIRKWAVKVLDQLAPVAMTEATKMGLEKFPISFLVTGDKLLDLKFDYSKMEAAKLTKYGQECRRDNSDVDSVLACVAKKKEEELQRMDREVERLRAPER